MQTEINEASEALKALRELRYDAIDRIFKPQFDAALSEVRAQHKTRVRVALFDGGVFINAGSIPAKFIRDRRYDIFLRLIEILTGEGRFLSSPRVEFSPTDEI